MDFDALLTAHRVLASNDTTTATTPSSTKNVYSSIDASLDDRLDAPLSSNRFVDPEQHHNNNHRHSKERQETGGRNKNDSGTAKDVGFGVYEIDGVMGRYDLWLWSCSSPDDVCVQFEARGDHDIALIVTSQPREVKEHCVEFVIGGWRNTKSVIRSEAQGPERASAIGRPCTSNEFRAYWAICSHDFSACGVGAVPGKNILVAWRDMSYMPLDEHLRRFVSFTTWDEKIEIRDIRVSKASDLVAPEELAAETRFELFQDPGIIAFEQERQINEERSKRFGTEFVIPDASKFIKPRATFETGFATGFDIEAPEEVALREERAKRFGGSVRSEAEAAIDNNNSELLLAERMTRSQRFGVPLLDASRLVSMQTTVPRRDPLSDDRPRLESLHVFGAFQDVFTKHILSTFREFGAYRIEWLDDCSCNVLFGDEHSASRALAGTSRELPLVPETEELISKQVWRYGEVVDRKGVPRPILIRRAVMTDVKSDDPAHRTIVVPSLKETRKKRERDDSDQLQKEEEEAKNEEEENNQSKRLRHNNNDDNTEDL